MLINYPKESALYAIENKKQIIYEEEYIEQLSKKISTLKSKENVTNDTFKLQWE